MISLTFGLLIGAAMLVLALRNADPVTLHLFVADYQASLALILIAAFGVGVLTAALMILPGLIKAKWQVRVLMKRNKSLAEEADISRSMAGRATSPQPVESPDMVDVDEDLKN